MVSVIIPAYNVEDYIDRCLNSVVNQSYNDIEIILIDDGSCDKTGEKCLEWAKKDKRIIFIRRKNMGQGNSRNLGIYNASGEYIMFVDGDDFIHKEMVRKLYNEIIKNDCDIVGGGNYMVYEDNSTKEIIKEIALSNYNFTFDGISNLFEKKELILNTPEVLWLNMYKKSLFLENNIKMPEITCEDTAVIPMLLLKAKKVCRIDENLYYYVVNRQSSTMNNNIAPMADSIKAYKFVIDFYKENKCFKIFYKQLRELFINRMEYMKNKYNGKISKNEYLENIKKYEDFLNENFSDWKEEKKLLLIGSPNVLNCISTKNKVLSFFEDYEIGKRADYIKNIDKKIVSNTDYIVLDFLGINNNKTDFNEFIKQINIKFKNLPVILLKNYYMENYIEENHIKKFDKIEEIKEKNKQLYNYYKIFEKSRRHVFSIECEKKLMFCENAGSPMEYSDYLLRNINFKITDVL